MESALRRYQTNNKAITGAVYENVLIVDGIQTCNKYAATIYT